MPDPHISLRPVTRADLTLLREWMKQPHWQDWWGDPDTELSMIEDMVEGRDTTRPFLFVTDGKEKGYIQVWFCEDWHHPPYTETDSWILDLPREAVGVDLSIGAACDLSSGLGSTALRAFCEKLYADGHHEIFIDPDPENARAVRAYITAGFVPYAPLEGRTENVLILRYHPDTKSSDR
jgi:RimJ/RimL family protein N-acetyltransferase